MPRNSSGVYTSPSSSWSPGINGSLATAGDFNALLADLSAALTDSVSRGGNGALTANLNAGNNKITNLAAGTGAGDALRWQQLFEGGTMADIASAATVDIGSQNTSFLRVTGTTTITSFGGSFRGPRFITFEGIVTLTNSSTLVLPGGANITTAAGDSLIVIPGATAGTADKWVVVAYQNNIVPGSAIIPDGSITAAKLADTAAVKLTLDQTIAGVKTFSSSPVVPTPTTDTQAANKAYVDSRGGITTATAVTASGTSVDFTSIPSWVKRITVMVNGLSSNGTASFQAQLGAGSVQTTGYVSSNNSTSSSTTGLLLTALATGANNYQGSMVISLLGSNTWVYQSGISRNDGLSFFGAGSVTLSGALDRVRITTFNGTDSFDAGTINISYEG